MSANSSMGIKIANLRRNRNMTQEQLAEILDISIKHCSSVERGVSCLSLEKLIEVSELFDVTLDYLIIEHQNHSSELEVVYSKLPASIINILSSDNAEEVELLQEYLRLYEKIHSPLFK